MLDHAALGDLLGRQLDVATTGDPLEVCGGPGRGVHWRQPAGDGGRVIVTDGEGLGYVVRAELIDANGEPGCRVALYAGKNILDEVPSIGCRDMT